MTTRERTRVAAPRRRSGPRKPAEIDWAALEGAARLAREHAYAPYSQYRVGAALLCEDGRIFSGANVENASFGLSICAERNAVGAAIAAGARRFIALLVVTGGAEPATPCGACRQVLAEFAPRFVVRCISVSSSTTLEFDTATLLPHGFSTTVLEGGRS